MKEVIKNYIDYLLYERKLSDYTVKNYQIDINNYALYLQINYIDYLKITKDDIREYLKYLIILKRFVSTLPVSNK